MNRPKTSAVWQHFQLNEDGVPCCKHCTKKFSKSSSTSVLKYHAEHNHRISFSSETRSTSSSPAPSSSGTSGSGRNRQSTLLEFQRPRLTKAQQQSLDEFVARWLWKDMRPVYAVEGDGFKDMMGAMNPAYVIRARDTYMKIIKKHYTSLIATVKGMLKPVQYYSLTIIGLAL